MRFIGVSIILIDSLTLGAVLNDPCRALHDQSFCMDNGLCYGLSSAGIDALTGRNVPLSCIEAYLDPRVNSLELPLLAEAPIIKPITSREFSKLVQCESHSTDFEALIPFLTDESHEALFDSMLTTLGILQERLRSMFPYFLYDAQVDGESLRQLVSGARTIATAALAPLPRELIGEFQCVILNSGFSKAISTYLDLYSREISSNPNSDIARTLLNNLTPFVHAWLKANSFLGINFPIWRVPNLSIVTTMAQYDPLYTTDVELKTWSIPIAEPTLKNPHHQIIPIVADPEFPISVLDALSLPEEGVRDSGKMLAASLVQFFADHDGAIAYAFLRASIFYLRFHESATDSDRSIFCTAISPIVNEIVENLSNYKDEVMIAFGQHGLSEYLHLCGTGTLSLSQRVGIFLRVMLGRGAEK